LSILPSLLSLEVHAPLSAPALLRLPAALVRPPVLLYRWQCPGVSGVVGALDKTLDRRMRDLRVHSEPWTTVPLFDCGSLRRLPLPTEA
jgi:hypothetical protein